MITLIIADIIMLRGGLTKHFGPGNYSVTGPPNILKQLIIIF